VNPLVMTEELSNPSEGINIPNLKCLRWLQSLLELMLLHYALFTLILNLYMVIFIVLWEV